MDQAQAALFIPAMISVHGAEGCTSAPAQVVEPSSNPADLEASVPPPETAPVTVDQDTDPQASTPFLSTDAEVEMGAAQGRLPAEVLVGQYEPPAPFAPRPKAGHVEQPVGGITYPRKTSTMLEQNEPGASKRTGPLGEADPAAATSGSDTPHPTSSPGVNKPPGTDQAAGPSVSVLSAPVESQVSGGDVPAELPASLSGTAASAETERPVLRGLEFYARQPAAADPAGQLAPRIAQALMGRQHVVSVQLHPVELGMVEIRIVVDANRKVRATMRADQPETIDLLQRHLASIERALTATGLTLAEQEPVNFDLGMASDREGSRDEKPGQGRAGSGLRADAAEANLQMSITAPLSRLTPSTGLLDLVL